MARVILAQAYVHRLFELDATLGLLRWQKRPDSDFQDGKHSAESVARQWNKKYAGQIAGYLTKGGYRVIGIDNRLFKAHSLIWFFVHGVWPDRIDHERGTSEGDRLDNMRIATQAENMRNRRIGNRNTSGVIGVGMVGKKWIAQIWFNGQKHFLGTFSTKEDAAHARKAAEIKYGFHANHGRRV